MIKSNKNKFCCAWFSIFYQHPNNRFCIRIIKLISLPALYPVHIDYAPGDTGKDRVVKNSAVEYRFFLMHPYEKYDTLLPGTMLCFCPFCGENLFTFYGKKRNIEDYLNEIEGVTF